MVFRRITALLLAVLIIAGSGAALAAPGDANDPLISESYITNQLKPSLEQAAGAIIELAFGRLAGKYASLLEQGSISTGRFALAELPSGERVNMSMGGSVILLGGSARLEIAYGTIINVTTGSTVDSGGELIRGNRYLAAESTSATVMMTGAGTVALDGNAFRGERRATFSDVPYTHWAFEYVELLAGEGIVSGRGGGIFDPDGNMTRADFVTILGRLHGVDTAAYVGADFSDVPVGQYYTAYVKWASENGIVTGYGGGAFGPSDRIQRSQMALIIVRYARFANISLAAGTAGDKFADDARLPDWARSEVYIARDSGLINGVGNNSFAPGDGATRAQVCAIIARLLAL